MTWNVSNAGKRAAKAGAIFPRMREIAQKNSSRDKNIFKETVRIDNKKTNSTIWTFNTIICIPYI